MSDDDFNALKVGSVRPSQMTHTYGVGALVELPYLSVIVTSADQWKLFGSDGQPLTRELVEPRLLEAVRYDLSTTSVQALRTPPWMPQTDPNNPAKDKSNWVGVWGWPFPRWLRCNYCNRMSTADKPLFAWENDPRAPANAGYWHKGCYKNRDIRATPVRVVVACTEGHLDDFPWVEFAHRKTGHRCQKGAAELYLNETGYAQRATNLEVECRTCGETAGLDFVFGPNGAGALPKCRGRHPHTKQFKDSGCNSKVRAMLLGASNLWFPLKRSALSIPGPLDDAAAFVAEHADKIASVESRDDLDVAARFVPELRTTDIPLDDIWKVLEQRNREGGVADEAPDLLLPEWEMFTTSKTRDTKNFSIRDVGLPGTAQASVFGPAKQLTRLREVVALTGFTRIDSLDADDDADGRVTRAPIWKTTERPRWVPAAESRGEGILVTLDEEAVQTWEQTAEIHPRMTGMVDAHRAWRIQRRLDPDGRIPDARYVMLHTISHMLINELALEAGYNTASIKERLYARTPEHKAGPMAGIMLYTAEPDSEGTLGGLVALGAPERLGSIIDAAVARAGLCSTDPFCSEHEADAAQSALHGAACHVCMFLPETSCESANRYLDRSFAVETLSSTDGLALFKS